MHHKSPNEAWRDITVKGVVRDEVTAPRNDGTAGSALYRVPFQLSGHPPSEWSEIFVRIWDRPPRYSTMHRPGIASVIGDRLILDGTTLEEVRDVHKETLELVLERTNQEYRSLVQNRIESDKIERQRLETHRQHVEDVADQIAFTEDEEEH